MTGVPEILPLAPQAGDVRLPEAGLFEAVDPGALAEPVVYEPRAPLVTRVLREARAMRHVPAQQIAHRARFALLHAIYSATPGLPIARARREASGSLSAAPLPALPVALIAPDGLEPVMRSADRLTRRRFLYLGRQADFAAGIRWRDPDASPLWLFQLHHLGSVVDLGLVGRWDQARKILRSWAGIYRKTWDEVAWHPHAVSIRLSNLCLAAGHGGSFDRLGPLGFELAAVHAAFLVKHVERDVGGHHLIDDAWALLLAGRCLSGPLAPVLEKTARRILHAEIPRQVLADGGHCELSPMYHVAVMHRLAQVGALLGGEDRLVAEGIAPALRRMTSFLRGITCPDGDIPLLGDSARGFAPHPQRILGVVRWLGSRWPELGWGQPDGPVTGGSAPRVGRKGDVHAARRRTARRVAAGPASLVRSFPDAGLHVLVGRRIWCIVDAGRTCADHLVGHGQADTFTVEVWVDGERVVCDPAVHEYSGPWRYWGRSSRAHSTVTIDDADTSEVYGSFRTGARARVLQTQLGSNSVIATLELPNTGVRIRRIVRLHVEGGTERLEIRDEVKASASGRPASRLHLAPGCTVAIEAGAHRNAQVATPKGAMLTIRSRGGIQAEAGRASTTFGECKPSIILVQARRGDVIARRHPSLCFELEPPPRPHQVSCLTDADGHPAGALHERRGRPRTSRDANATRIAPAAVVPQPSPSSGVSANGNANGDGSHAHRARRVRS